MLEDLKKTGLYGGTPTTVATRLVIQGIQDAITKTHINVRQVG